MKGRDTKRRETIYGVYSAENIAIKSAYVSSKVLEVRRDRKWGRRFNEEEFVKCDDGLPIGTYLRSQ